MNETLTKLLLGPLFLAQGAYARLATPRLPEPLGSRQGTVGAGQALRLLVMGDSCAAGVGVNTQEEALSRMLVSRLAGDFQVSWRLLARSGLVTREAPRLLRQLCGETFDVAVVSVGGNDVVSWLEVSTWRKQLAALIDALHREAGVREVVISYIPPMHLFIAMPQPLRWYVGRKTVSFNAHMERLICSRPHCHFLEPDIPLDSSLLAVEGFHPGPIIYQLWADSATTIIKTLFHDGRNQHLAAHPPLRDRFHGSAVAETGQ